MKLAYQFSRHEIHLCDISFFQTLFGLERIKEMVAQKRAMGNALIGSMKIKFEQDERGLLPYEDPAIRNLCTKLFQETPAAFLEESPENSMSSLFLSTLKNFTAVSITTAPDLVRFDADVEKTRAHGMRFQERIVEIAESLGMEWEYYMPHCARMRSPLFG